MSVSVGLLKLKTASVNLLTLTTLSVAFLFSWEQLDRSESPWVEDSSVRYRPLPVSLYRVSSLGHLPLTVDWQWIKALQDPEIYHVPQGVHAAIFRQYALLTELDPLFRQGYTVGAKLLAIIRNDIEGARILLEKARTVVRDELPKHSPQWRAHHWHNEWEISYLLGYLHLFEKGDLPTSTAYFIEASQMPGSPEYLKSFGERLRRPSGVYEVGLRMIQGMIDQERRSQGPRESSVLRELLKKRDSLFLQEYLFQINEQFRDYLMKKSSFRQATKISRSDLETAFKAFVRREGLSLRDPFGGLIRLSPEGKVVSSTPVVPVLGIK